MSVLVESLSQGLWLILCGTALIAAVAGTVFTVRRRALSGSGDSSGSDQLFWDLFLGAAVAVPALLIPTLIAPWTGLVLGGVAAAAAVASYRASPRIVAWHVDRRESREQASAHREAAARHDALIARWQGHELNVANAIDYPAFSDVRTPETSALIKALRAAENLRGCPQRDYPAAVAGLARSLAAAESAAGMPAHRA